MSRELASADTRVHHKRDMRLGLLSLLGLTLAMGALAAAEGCATEPAPAEDTPNLASRRPLPSASGTETPPPPAPADAATSTPTEDAAPRDASAADGAQDTSAPPPVDASGVPQAAAGDIVISEVLFDPSGAEPESEWIEIGCRATSARTLRGLTLEDGAGRTHVITTDVVVSPGKFVVLARTRASALAQGIAAADIGYEYGAGLGASAGVILANGSSGAISILSGATALVRVPYGTFNTGASGASIEQKLTAAPGVAVAADYCVSTTPFGTQLGTPGRAPVCP